jgi:hypothetical protein
MTSGAGATRHRGDGSNETNNEDGETPKRCGSDWTHAKGQKPKRNEEQLVRRNSTGNTVQEKDSRGANDWTGGDRLVQVLELETGARVVCAARAALMWWRWRCGRRGV